MESDSNRASRGDLMTCNLHLSKNSYDSAAKCAGCERRQPSGNDRRPRKKETKVFSDNFISSEK